MKLRAYLDQHGLTNKQFAERVGVTGLSIGRYADEGRVPEPATMRKIIECTGGAVTANDFFDGVPAPADPSAEAA